ncbi:MAG: tetratricopeptide repeat protein [FCB group bacterium]|nr:tetratricopeptide repeat protein [FCB group bacterium]
MRYTFLALILLMAFIGCDRKSAKIETYWSNALELREADKLGEAISQLKMIARDFPESAEAPEAIHKVGEIFLNDVKDYEIAIEEFQTVIDNYPDSEMAAKALFMIGYVYANYLEAYSDAADRYQSFIDQYPDHELVPSVQFELDDMKDILSEIDQLNAMAN